MLKLAQEESFKSSVLKIRYLYFYNGLLERLSRMVVNGSGSAGTSGQTQTPIWTFPVISSLLSITENRQYLSYTASSCL